MTSNSKHFNKNSVTDDKIYGSDFIYKFSEKISYQFIGPIFNKLPFTPNQITLFNFFTNNLAAVYFFTLGTHLGYMVGLLFCFSSAVFDWMDGHVARSRGKYSTLGPWLDPAVDFVWQHLLAAALILGVYNSKGGSYSWLVAGLFMLTSLVIANHLGHIFAEKFNFKFRSSTSSFRKEIYHEKKSTWFDKLCLEILAPTSFLTLFIFTIRYSLLFGALLNKMDIALIIIATSSFVKAITLFYTYALYLQQNDVSKAPLQIVKSLNKRVV